MDRNEITTNIREQEDQAMPPLIAFDKEKLFAMQKQILEGINQPRISQQRLSQRSEQHTKGASEETSGRSLEEDEVQGGCS